MFDAALAHLLDLANALILDLEGRILFWTNDAQTTYGWTAEEAVGQLASDLLHTRCPTPLERIRAHVIEDGEWTGELVHTTKDGVELVIASRWVLHRDDGGAPSAILVIDTDLTRLRQRERRQAQTELERRAEILESITDAFYALDRQWRFAYINRECERYYGVVREQLLGRVVWDAFPEARDTVFEEQYHRAVRDQVAVHFEALSPLSHRWIEVHAFPSPDGLSVYFRDITDRKWSEQERERFFALGADLLVVAGLDGMFKWVSPTWERALGWSAAELTSHPWLYFVHPQDQQSTIAAGEQLFSGTEVIAFENRYRHRDGTYRWISWRVRPFLDEGVLYGAAMDVTDRKETEEALREREHRFRAAFEQAAVGMVHASVGGRFLRVNERFCRMLGYRADELVGKRFSDVTHPDDAASVAAILSSNGPLGLDATSVDQRYIHTSGAIVDTHVTATQVDEGSGSEPYVMAVVEDITERRLLEDQLRQAQRMEAVGRLAGGVAHDFNNLLTIISGYSDLTLRRLATDDPLRSNVEEIYAAADRAAGLTRQLLAFSRKQMFKSKVINLNSVVADLTRMLERLIGEDITLVTILDAALGRTKVDPGQIEQVIVNLAVNARDAMRGGGTLTIETRDVELDDAYLHTHMEAAPGHYALIAVSDTGHGMDAQVASKIFEPFFTTKPPGAGTGLGLSTVYGIVKQSEGSISVYSEPGRGTTFKIYLPRVDDPATPEEQRPIAGSLDGSDTVLIVEDDANVRRIAVRALEQHGYAVIDVGDADEAMLVCQEHSGPIHLLLTDVVMPKVYGGQLAERLRAQRPELRVLFMSGYTENSIVHHGVLDEGVEFIQKPFTVDALARKVREVLDARPA